jgi:hypothetical protein
MGHLWWSLRIGLWPQDQPPHYSMAKLGQLYLQNGEAAPGDQLVASSWVQESETNQLAPGDSSSSMASVEAAQLLVPIIIDNLGDLTVKQTTCGAGFCYWKYFSEHSGQLLSTGLRDMPKFWLGREPV